MEHQQIPRLVFNRLPVYLAYLKSLPADSGEHISATTLANALGMGQVQVRKDLAMVSTGGKPKVGYDRLLLMADISRFLGYDDINDAVLIGAGKLGGALLSYGGFAEYGLNILAAFDTRISAESAGEKPIYPMEELSAFCRENHVLMGIITVPAAHAQQVCDSLISCGVKAIWNFAPTHLDVPAGILVQNEDMATSLAVLSKHLTAQMQGH